MERPNSLLEQKQKKIYKANVWWKFIDLVTDELEDCVSVDFYDCGIAYINHPFRNFQLRYDGNTEALYYKDNIHEHLLVEEFSLDSVSDKDLDWLKESLFDTMESIGWWEE